MKYNHHKTTIILIPPADNVILSKFT